MIGVKVPDPRGIYRIVIADFHRHVCARIDCRKDLKGEFYQCFGCLSNGRKNLSCNPKCCLKSKHKHLGTLPTRVPKLPKVPHNGPKICVVCAQTVPRMKKCRACLNLLGVNVYYCSVQCTKDDAPRHRRLCAAAAK